MVWIKSHKPVCWRFTPLLMMLFRRAGKFKNQNLMKEVRPLVECSGTGDWDFGTFISFRISAQGEQVSSITCVCALSLHRPEATVISETELRTQTMDQHHSLLCLFCHQDIKLVNTIYEFSEGQWWNGMGQLLHLIFGHLLVLTHLLFQRRYHTYNIAMQRTWKKAGPDLLWPIKPMGGDCWLWTSLHHQLRGLLIWRTRTFPE